MQRLKLALVPICIGAIFLFVSWFVSYPVSIDSQYDFLYNHFSYLYWIGLVMLFVSFFVVAMKTNNSSIRWAMAVGTILLMFSQAYFYYLIPGSDNNQFRGLIEYFLSTGDLSSSNHYHYYFQWPLVFILNKIAIVITGLDLRHFEFILYGIISSLITSFVYLHVSRVRTNSYVAVVAFFVMLIPIFLFEFLSAFALGLSLILLLLYLDNLSGKRAVQLTMLLIFVGISFTHILVPLFFIFYCLFRFVLKRSRKYLTLFITTSIIYSLVLVQIPMFVDYLKALTIPYFLEISSSLATISTANLVAPQPYISVIASLFSRSAVITTLILSGLGFIFLLKRRKLGTIHYAMLLTGSLFIVGLLISPRSYHELSNRSYFLIFIPVSLGASYLCEIKLRKYAKSLFLILLVLFTFTLIGPTFYDRQIFFQTKAEHQSANFLIDSINWNSSVSVFSHFRVDQYLKAKSYSSIVRYGNDLSLSKFPEELTNYTYVVYTIGIAKTFLAANFSVQESFSELDANYFSLIYNSGNSNYIFSK